MLHGNRVDFTKIRESDHNPENNQDSDHKAPDPSARMHYAVCGERSVIDHDGGPANELQYIQDSKKDASLLSKTHFYGFHGTFSDPAADHACQKQHQASDDMADKNRCQTFSHAERCKVGSGQDFGNRDTCPKPDQPFSNRPVRFSFIFMFLSLLIFSYRKPF